MKEIEARLHLLLVRTPACTSVAPMPNGAARLRQQAAVMSWLGLQLLQALEEAASAIAECWRKVILAQVSLLFDK